MNKKATAVRGKFNAQKLKNKEENYRKINAQLEAKTASLVKEAEDLINEHTISDDDETKTDLDEKRPHTVGGMKPVKSIKTQGVKTRHHKPNSTRVSTAGAAVREDISVDIKRTMKEIELKLEREENQDVSERGNDAVFEVSENLSSEAIIRYLKAKLCVAQEEVEQLNKTNREIEKLYSTSEAKVKDLAEHNSKLEKSQQSLQSQLVKYQQLSKEYNQKCEQLETQLLGLKSELESEKASQKKAASSYSATEVRLNRALEDVEKYKSLYTKIKSDMKDSAKLEKERIDSLESQNRLLERQKKELMTAFQKQMKLIDILKRQKIHLESARMLAFTEEEFVKALNWESNS